MPGIMKILLSRSAFFRPNLAPQIPAIWDPIAPPRLHRPYVNDIAEQILKSAVNQI